MKNIFGRKTNLEEIGYKKTPGKLGVNEKSGADKKTMDGAKDH